MNNDTNINIQNVPFSRYGAYVSITGNKEQKQISIHNVRRKFRDGNAFELIFKKNNNDIEYTTKTTPQAIAINSMDGSACLYIRDDNTIAIDTYGLDILLKQVCNHGYGVQHSEREFKFISASPVLTANVYIQKGAAQFNGPLLLSPAGTNRDHKQHLHVACVEDKVTLCLEMLTYDKPLEYFDINVESEVKEIENEWNSFLNKMPRVVKEYESFAQITWYNLWSSFVRKEDVYKYDAMLMSKKFMSSVWSWDHCFNALAMTEVGYQTAIEQFLLPFELQPESGVLPDMWNPNTETLWGVTKPPIHGWCFNKLMDKYDIDKLTLKKVYTHLEKWTNWWMECRDSDHDGIPEYPQGCDSGWDNSTLFDIGFFLESPDLSSFLVLQMKTLARISLKIGNSNKANEWENKATILLNKLYEHSWNGERFLAKLSSSHDYAEYQTSLLEVMPIVLGDLLDKDKFNKLVSTLEQNYLTENGPATEMLHSTQYESNGYWRGPIWAPSTYLLVDGLKRGGREDLAKEIAKNFCDMVQNKAKGNFENFDAVTGQGLCAPGYTWTASVFMLLLWEYLN